MCYKHIPSSSTGWNANLLENAVHDLPDLIAVGAWPPCHAIIGALDSPAKTFAPFITPPQDSNLHALVQATSSRRSKASM